MSDEQQQPETTWGQAGTRRHGERDPPLLADLSGGQIDREVLPWERFPLI